MLGEVAAEAFPVYSQQLCRRSAVGDRAEVGSQEETTALRVLKSQPKCVNVIQQVGDDLQKLLLCLSNLLAFRPLPTCKITLSFAGAFGCSGLVSTPSLTFRSR